VIPYLLHDLLYLPARAEDNRIAVECRGYRASYGFLRERSDELGRGLAALGLVRGERLAILLPKSIDAILAILAASRAGLVIVPINPSLKTAQVGHILRDCEAVALLTSSDRLAMLEAELLNCPALRQLLTSDDGYTGVLLENNRMNWAALPAVRSTAPVEGPRSDSELAALFYTSGSTGRPKGVMISHRNLVTGASSVASYLRLDQEDRILGLLTLAFDAGFSQLTSCLCAGATLVLKDYLFPTEVARSLRSDRITGLTAVPPLYATLRDALLTQGPYSGLRHFASTGSRMPKLLLETLRQLFPEARPYLMYGLTEAFRSTYLDPDEVDRRPGSVGKSIPNQDVLVVDSQGHRCAPYEHGEIVHRGSTVALGYWCQADATAAVFRPVSGADATLFQGQLQVHSGDYGYCDEQGFLFVVDRRDAQIKTRGYRVSPTEIEEIADADPRVREAAAVGLPDDDLGCRIVLVIHASSTDPITVDQLRERLSAALPAYMMPSEIRISPQPLARTGSGKLDRQWLKNALQENPESLSHA